MTANAADGAFLVTFEPNAAARAAAANPASSADTRFAVSVKWTDQYGAETLAVITVPIVPDSYDDDWGWDPGAGVGVVGDIGSALDYGYADPPAEGGDPGGQPTLPIGIPYYKL